MKLTKGSLLYTKDGRKIGNAIVVDIEYDPFMGWVYKIKTDFGNVRMFTGKEIEEYFYIGKLAYVSPIEQVRDQIKLLSEFVNSF